MRIGILPCYNQSVDSFEDFFRFEPTDSPLINEYIRIDPPKHNLTKAEYQKLQDAELLKMARSGKMIDVLITERERLAAGIKKNVKHILYIHRNFRVQRWYRQPQVRMPYKLRIPFPKPKIRGVDIESKENLILYRNDGVNAEYWDMIRHNLTQYTYVDISEINDMMVLIDYFKRAKLFITFNHEIPQDAWLYESLALSCNCFLLEPRRRNPYFTSRTTYPRELVRISGRILTKRWAKPKYRIKLTQRLFDYVYAVMENFWWYYSYAEYNLAAANFFYSEKETIDFLNDRFNKQKVVNKTPTDQD